jgi:hypothetical protein
MDIMATRARHSVPIDGNRLWSDVMALAAITDPERPYTRRRGDILILGRPSEAGHQHDGRGP